MLAIAFPMIVSSGCETVMMFTDRMFLSKLSMAEMSASMAGGMSFIFILSFFFGLLSYSTAMTGQFFGSGDHGKCSVVLTQAFFIAILAYPIMLIAKPFMHMLFTNTGIEEVQLGHQIVYFDTLVYASFLPLFRSAITNFFSGIGMTRVVMFATFSSMIVNVLANYVLIFGKFGFEPMGVKGAACGSIIGTLSGVLIMLAVYFRKTISEKYEVLKSFYFDKVTFKKLIRFGTPSGVELAMVLCAFNLMIVVFHSDGEVSAAASTILLNWDHVSFVPLLGLEIAVTSLVGRYVGMGRHDLVERTVKSGIKLGWMYSISILILFAFFPGPLADIFRPEGEVALYSEVRPIAVFMIRLAACYTMVNSIMLVYMGALKGTGDTFWSMIINLSYNWFMLGALYFAMKIMGASAATGWGVIVATFVFLPFILYARFRSGKWKTLNVMN